MNGFELARGYFEEYGMPMLKNEISDILPFLAVGFVGSGSEHYGFDDEISRDHDFEPGFCIFLPNENIISERQEFLLERAYAKLPKEYCSVRRLKISPVGGNRHGVKRTADYYLSAVGEKDGNLSVNSWLHIPDSVLAEATNGEIYFDNYGEFTQIRDRLKNMPEDIRLKRLAGSLLIMGQSGQYNFLRCIGHGEPQAAQLALNEFVNSAIRAAFILDKKYMPFYKWSFRALRQNESRIMLANRLSFLLSGDNTNAQTVKEKSEAIEEISAEFISELQKRNISHSSFANLENHAYSVNDNISDSEIRNMNIFEGA